MKICGEGKEGMPQIYLSPNLDVLTSGDFWKAREQTRPYTQIPQRWIAFPRRDNTEQNQNRLQGVLDSETNRENVNCGM